MSFKYFMGFACCDELSKSCPNIFQSILQKTMLSSWDIRQGTRISLQKTVRVQLYPYCIRSNMLRRHISFLPGEVDTLPEQTHPICAYAHSYMFWPVPPVPQCLWAHSSGSINWSKMLKYECIDQVILNMYLCRLMQSFRVVKKLTCPHK